MGAMISVKAFNIPWNEIIHTENSPVILEMGLMISEKAFNILWNWFAYECQRANIASGGIARDDLMFVRA